MVESYASPEVVPACKRLCAGRVCGALGSPLLERRTCFHVRTVRLLPPTFCFEALRSLIFCSGPPPQRSFTSLALPRFFRIKARLPGVLSLITTSPIRVHSLRHFPSPATFRPQAFSTSRRFAPRIGSQAYFIPLPRPGFSSVQGLLPSRSLSLLIEESCPLAVSRPTAHAPKYAATFDRLGFEALLHVRSRCRTAWCYPLPWLAPLLGLLSPPGASARREVWFPNPLRS